MSCQVTQPIQRTPLWPAFWLPAVEKGWESKSVEVQSVWEVYDERLQFMSRHDATWLDESLDADDVSHAWLVWSCAAETALEDAYRFSGGPVPTRGLVLGRRTALFRVVRLGGTEFGRLAVMLLMLMMLLMSLCIGTLPLLLCLI